MEEHGQASPSDVPFTCVRVAGHISESPSTNTDHSVGRDMVRFGEACVVGWERR